MKNKTLKQRMKRFWDDNILRIALIGFPIITLIVGIIIGVGVTSYIQSVKINDYDRTMMYTSYTVQSGDTLWNIAEDLLSVNPEFTDIRQYIFVIRNVNHLYDDNITEGQSIIIPYYVGKDGIIDYNSIYEKYGIRKGTENEE